MKTDTRTINGSQWRVTAWPARVALKHKARLVKMLGPSLGALLSNSDPNRGVLEQDLANVRFDKVAALLTDRLDEQNIGDLIVEMLAGHTAINDTPVDESFFDSHFSANFGELYQGLTFVLEVNFGSFLSATTAIVRTPGRNEQGES